MLMENITYLVTITATTGLAVIGSLVAYQLDRETKTPVLQILLYEQIFLFTFFIHAIWGNLAIRQVLVDLEPGVALAQKLSFFFPLTGLPFLITGWFMLLKFGFNLNGYKVTRKWTIAYFSVFLLLMIAFAFLFQNGFLGTPTHPDNLLIRVFVVANLFFHLLFSWPFLKPGGNAPTAAPNRNFCKCLAIYSTGIGIYSVMLWFSASMNYLFINFSFLILFATNGMLPVCFKLFGGFTEEKEPARNRSFQSFCRNFEISKREAEVILEICSGKTNKAIAEKLFITLQTVKDHTHHIYTKTQVKSRVQLTNLVREMLGENF